MTGAQTSPALGTSAANAEFSMAQQVLVVEDEPAIAESVAYALTEEGYKVRTAASGEQGLQLYDAVHPDLVILDLMLPGMGGIDVCRALRHRSAVPVIILTARASETDRVIGLEVGADDYVTKPFSMRELIARVRAALRRQSLAQQSVEQSQFRDERLSVDFERPSVRVEGEEVQLSPQELSLLKALLAHRGRVQTREQLLEEAWGDAEFVTQRTVDVHIRWLRQKLEADPEHPRYIETVRGIGYRFGRWAAYDLPRARDRSPVQQVELPVPDRPSERLECDGRPIPSRVRRRRPWSDKPAANGFDRDRPKLA
jgi:DNA-binding response OmpR family regulator